MKIEEFIHGAKLKVLKWNENLPGDRIGGNSEPEGILMFRVHDKVQVLRNLSSPIPYQQIRKAGFSSKSNGVNYPPLIITSKIVLPIPPLSVSATQNMFIKNISSLNCFHPNNHRFLAKLLAEDFLTCFSFDARTLRLISHRNSDFRFKLVLVVDVRRKFVHVIPKPILVSDQYQACFLIKQEEEEEETVGKYFRDDYSCNFGDEFSNSELWDILEKLRHGKFPSYNQYRRKSPRIIGPRELSEVKASIKMSSVDGKKLEEDDQCSICLDGFSKECRRVAIMPCSHIFHTRCALKWLIKSRSCPLCRSVCKSTLI